MCLIESWDENAEGTCYYMKMAEKLSVGTGIDTKYYE